jgi:dUTP pyrophosphatase
VATELCPGAVLSGATIRRLVASEPPLVSAVRDLDRQLQPNGIDLTLASVWHWTGRGQLGTADGDRTLPDRVEVAPDRDGYYELPPGGYVVLLNEVVNLPTDLMAFGRPRSSLLRCGVALHTAVWDAGYSGRSESLLIVYNPAGVRLRRDARILQLVFCALDRPTEPYAGRFQNENLG